MSLHPVHGHGEIRSALVRAHRAGTLPSALLLHGPPGVGKQRLALWIAQLDLCESPSEAGPCGACRSCRLGLRLEHPDVHWYFPLPRPKRAPTPEKMADALEEARAARLAELRDTPLQYVSTDDPTGIYLAAARALRKRAQSRPSMSDRQIFVIGDAETLVPQEASPEAANALLKLLEEPPADCRFVLTSSEPGSLLDTIRSRTVPLGLGPLPVEDVTAFLVGRGVDAEVAATAAHLGQGALGRTLGFLPEGALEGARDGEDGPLEKVRKKAFGVLRAGLSPRVGDAFRVGLGESVSGARALLGLLAALELWLRDLAAVAAEESERVVNRDAVPWMTRQVRERRIRPDLVARALPRVDEAALQARGNVNPQLLMAGLVADLRRLLTVPDSAEVATHGR